MPDAFVTMIEQAAAKPGEAMTGDEFLSWLVGQAVSSR
jgi:hypothetical protein